MHVEGKYMRVEEHEIVVEKAEKQDKVELGVVDPTWDL